MSLVKRTEKMPFMLEDFFNTDWLGGTVSQSRIGFNVPAVNVIENDDEFIVQLAAPGLKKENFAIELDNDTLTISSKRKEEKEDSIDDKVKFTRKEFTYTEFKRSFNLPESINTGEISATYEDGILHAILPKREEAKVQPKRLIEIA
ncbi:Hsp20/alpha crystallin family protein [Aquimarina sp. W85]|uniref:Hsp20/alpha crystallin family protein n=1 Tax=Aquimarina rhodophyticola TaxID=3342246 RepID=UPI00366B5AFE